MRCVGFCLWFCCILAVGIGQILPAVETEDEKTIIFAVISELNRDLQIANYVTFLGIQSPQNATTSATSLQQSLMESFNGSVLVAGPGVGKLNNIINKRNVAIVFFNGTDDPILAEVHSSLENLRTVWIIFVYKSNGNLWNKSEFTEIFFNWCYNYHFNNVMLILRSNDKYEIWTYEVKSTVTPLKFSVSSIRQAICIKKCKRSEVRSPRSLVAVYQSLPDAFVVSFRGKFNENDFGYLQLQYNSSSGVRLGGGIGILLNSFMESLKGSIGISEMSFDKYMKRISLRNTKDRHFDIGANMISNFTESLHSPVWMVTQLCLVLPNERRTFIKYFSDIYDTKLTLICFMVFYTLLNAVVMWIINPRATLARIFFNSLRLTVGQCLIGKAFRRLSLPEKYIEISTQIFTVLIMNIIIGAVTTALITGLRKPRIVDTETFLESGLHVMVFPYQLEDEFDFLPQEIKKRFLVVDKKERDRHMYALNDSYAYITVTHKWMILEYIQSRLHQPKLRLATEKLCSAQRYIKLYVCSGMCYSKVLKHFTLKVHEFGLTSKWMHQGLRQAEEAGFVTKAPYDPVTRNALPLKFYQLAFELYGLCLLLSLVSFLLECLIVYLRNPNTVFMT